MSGEVCRFFLQGKCRFGSRCRNLHPRDSSNRGYSDHSNRGYGNAGQNNRYSDGPGYNQRRGGNQYEVFNSWQNSEGGGGGRGGGGGGRGWSSGHGYGQGRRRYDSVSSYRPPQGGTVGGEPTSPEEIAQVIREDMEMWAESHMWPFSCYSYKREGSCLPGLSDVSPEELRWKAYQARVQAGGQMVYQEGLQKLLEQVLSVRGEMMRVHTRNIEALISSDTSTGPQSLFGALPPSSSSQPLFSSPLFPSSSPSSQPLFSSSPSPSSSTSLFPPTTQSTTSFGSSKATHSTAVFGGPSQGGLFGGLPTGSAVGGPSFGNLSGGSAPLGVPISQPPLQPTPTVTAHQGAGVQSPPSNLPLTSSTAATPQLTLDELNAFKSDHFVLGQIPETPPPPELI